MGNMNGHQDLDLTIPEPRVSVWGGPARVGAELRHVRERLGWQLPDVAARLKIRHVFLEAIEAGNLSALPGPAYAAGFIRSYADAMGLDADEVLRRFEAEGMSPPQDPVLAFPKPVPDRAVPPGAIVFVVVIVAIGGYFLWYRHSEHELRMAQQIPAVPAKLAPLAVSKSPPPPAPGKTSGRVASTQGGIATKPAVTSPAIPAAQTAPRSAQPQAAAGPSAGAAPDASAGPVAHATSAPPAGNPGRAQTSPSVSGTPNAPGAGSGASGPSSNPSGSQPVVATGTSGALVIGATADSWIQVRGPNGTILVSRILKPGQTWPVPDKPGLTLTTGNAGGTELIRKGVTGQPLGKAGTVLHNIQLTPPSTGGGTGPSSGSGAQ